MEEKRLAGIAKRKAMKELKEKGSTVVKFRRGELKSDVQSPVSKFAEAGGIYEYGDELIKVEQVGKFAPTSRKGLFSLMNKFAYNGAKNLDVEDIVNT